MRNDSAVNKRIMGRANARNNVKFKFQPGKYLLQHGKLMARKFEMDEK
jgi:hypothetical protein